MFHKEKVTRNAWKDGRPQQRKNNYKKGTRGGRLAELVIVWC